MDDDEPLHPGLIGQVSLPVVDIERSVAFYEGVLGLAHLYTFGLLAFFDCAGVRLYLSGEPDSPRPPSATVIYFRVEDIQRAYDVLGGRGVVFEDGPHRVHRHKDGIEEWMAFFRDPDGNILALMSLVKPPPT